MGETQAPEVGFHDHTAPPGPIPTWELSRWKDKERCPLSFQAFPECHPAPFNLVKLNTQAHLGFSRGWALPYSMEMVWGDSQGPRVWGSPGTTIGRAVYGPHTQQSRMPAPVPKRHPQPSHQHARLPMDITRVIAFLTKTMKYHTSRKNYDTNVQLFNNSKVNTCVTTTQVEK